MKNLTRFRLTQALVVSGLIFYIPANVVPVMTMTVAGDVQPLTVLGGVEELYNSGLWPVAGIVFLASIVVPLLKLLSLSWMLLLHGTNTMRPQRTTVHRIIHQIGTWSMIDIFLLAVLAAVGQLGILASVQAEPGSLFFAAVLLSTLFAAEVYEAKLIWQTEVITAAK